LSYIFTSVLLIVALGANLFPEIVEAAGNNLAFFVLTDKAFGPWFFGLAGIVVIAAGMSMVSVIMNCHGVIIAENFIKPFRKKVTSEARMLIARWSLLIYSIVAIGFALLDLPNLYSIALIAYEGIAQIVPMLVFSLYWRRSNKYGALIGFVVGLLVAIIFTTVRTNQEIVTAWWTGGVAGLVVNVIIHVVCGFICPKDVHVDELFGIIDEYEKLGGRAVAAGK
jgi:SSS family solute:Na+ symporter